MSEEHELSKNQIDRLGSRLRNSAEPSDEDLRLLNRYRERFIPVHDEILGTLRRQLSYPLESRHKSVPSIIAKLRRRQPARLSAIQDIAGARIILSAPGTIMQHTWAQLSERLADRYGFELKYGGGPEEVRDALLEYAGFAAIVERFSSGVMHEGKVDEGAIDDMKQFVARLPAIVNILERT